MSLTIKRVVDVKQKDPARFEVKVHLEDGTATVVLLSTLAFAELIQRGDHLFQLGASASGSQRNAGAIRKAVAGSRVG